MKRALGIVVAVGLALVAVIAPGASAAGAPRCAVSQQLVAALQRDSHLGSKTFNNAALRRARVAEVRMARIRAHAPDRATARRAARALSTFRAVVRAARGRHRHGAAVQRAIGRYVAASASLLKRLSATCGAGARAAAGAAPATTAEQEGHHGVNTFTNPHNASGVGPAIGVGAWVQVSCKLLDPYIKSVNPDGYWYRIASPPWNDNYYAPANTFMNGDAWDGPSTHNTDDNVPDCGAAAPAPVAAPSVTLAQGPAAPAGGFAYTITVDHFPASAAVTLSCRDTANPAGFATVSLPTDATGHATTESACSSAAGPDHWVVVDDGVESNHVTWAGTAAPPAPDTCKAYSGVPIANHGVAAADPHSVSSMLLAHYLAGSGRPVVIDWSFFTTNHEFVPEATSLGVGKFVSGWAPSDMFSDMYLALGHFTIDRDTSDCYLVYDYYDFGGLYWPLALATHFGAKPFPVHASGKL